MQKMNIEHHIKANGKPTIKISKVCNTTYGIGTNQFRSKETDLFISEIKLNSLGKKDRRKFIVSIRYVGTAENEGDYRLTQFDFDKDELIELKEQLGNILDEKLVKDLADAERWNTQYFDKIKEICKYSHVGIEDGFARDTCRNKENIPAGASWGECNKKDCPLFKSVSK